MGRHAYPESHAARSAPHRDPVASGARSGGYRAVGVAAVVYPPDPPLLTLAGERRAGLWR